MEDEVVQTVSLWKKTACELTVSDQLKVAGVATLLGIAVPVAICAVTVGATTAWDKIQMCRLRKKVGVIETSV
jgi:hypothetical protein